MYAGAEGTPPFPIHLRSSIGSVAMQRFARESDMIVEHRCLYESAMHRTTRDRSFRVGWGLALAGLLDPTAPLGWTELNHTGCICVLRKRGRLVGARSM
jgi:hypothetical protein